MVHFDPNGRFENKGGLFRWTVRAFRLRPLVGNAAVLERLIALAVLLTVIDPSGARAEAPSPEMVACHKEAAQRYIADFRQVSPPQESFDGSPITVTTFQNENPRYEKYLAECMKREKRTLARSPAYSAREIWLSA